MKNLLFSIVSVVLLAFATSCQKEEIAPRNNVSQAQFNKGSGQVSTTTVAANEPIWENWNFCEKDFIVSKQLMSDKTWQLTVYDTQMNPNFKGSSMDYSLLTTDAKATLETMFPGQTAMATWRMANQFNTSATYFVEYDQDTMVAIVFLDAEGNVICKGTHE